MDLKEEDFLKEAFKIIDSNKSKASTLRNSILNLNESIYNNNNLNLQIIQFLGEFEYDLKTLIELLNDFKKKSKIHFQNKLNSLKKELNIIKKENISLKELKDNKTKNKINNKNKNGNSLNLRNTFDNNAYNQNKNKILKKSENFEKSQNFEKSLQKKENLSQNYFYTNKTKAKIVNNKNNKKNFCDYNSFLTNLKRNNSKSNFNFIKYENYKENNRKDKDKGDKDINEIARGKVNNSVRAQSANSKIIFKNCKNLNEEKKQKIINEIFQDEKILNALKKQFGNKIEDKLLNGDITTEFLLKIEEISDKMKKNNKNIKNNKNAQNLELKNKNLNLKIPKRYSNYKGNNSIDNLIITS